MIFDYGDRFIYQTQINPKIYDVIIAQKEGQGKEIARVKKRRVVVGNHASEKLKAYGQKERFHSNFPTVVDPSEVVDQSRADQVGLQG